VVKQQYINVREHRRGNQKWTIQTNWQHRVHKRKTKQNKNRTEYVLDTTIRKQIQITSIRHASSYKQLEVKMNRTWFYAEIVTDNTTRNSERNRTAQKIKDKQHGPHQKTRVIENDIQFIVLNPHTVTSNSVSCRI